MTRTRQASPALIILILAVVGIAVFGAARWALDNRAANSTTLPPLSANVEDSAARPGAMDPARLFAQRIDGVVTIASSFGDRPMSGTGFVVDREGHILTASHVVLDYESTGNRATSIYVQFHAGDRVAAQLIDVDTFNDIALLQVDPTQITKLVPMPIGDSDKLVTGAEVAAIGAPFGYEETLTLGTVSGVNRIIPSRINPGWQITDAIQTDAAINPGNSGGPLFNSRGEVVGINQQISSNTKQNVGVAFAVPINAAMRAMDQMLDGGGVRYPYLGINSTTVSPQLAKEYALAKPYGALASEVTELGPASRAGLSHDGPDKLFNGAPVRLGDQIVELAGRRVTSTDELQRIAARLDVGKPVDVVYYRDGTRHTAQLVPGERT